MASLQAPREAMKKHTLSKLILAIGAIAAYAIIPLVLGHGFGVIGIVYTMAPTFFNMEGQLTWKTWPVVAAWMGLLLLLVAPAIGRPAIYRWGSLLGSAMLVAS